MAQRITRQEVAHVAKLARLSFSDHELDELTSQLADVLDHAADVEALDVSHLKPTVYPLPLVNVVREDQLRSSLNRNDVLTQASAVADDQFKVPPAL